MTATKLIAFLLVVLIAAPLTRSQPRTNNERLAAQVRAEFIHAWNGYRKYAWGHDDLKPLSKTYHDWYAQSLLMTPVDALDTMILMGLKDEAKHTREYIDQNLSFDKDIEVQRISRSRFDCSAACFPAINSPATGGFWCWRKTWEIVYCPCSIRRPACLTDTSISRPERSAAM